MSRALPFRQGQQGSGAGQRHMLRLLACVDAQPSLRSVSLLPFDPCLLYKYSYKAKTPYYFKASLL